MNRDVATLLGLLLCTAVLGSIISYTTQAELIEVKANCQSYVPEPDKVIFMQGCMADDNKEYQCILMWREHDGS